MLKLQKLKETMARAYGEQYLDVGDRIIKILIDDVPVMRSDDGKIVCLARERIENLKIGIFGTTGSGKTSLLVSILSRLYYSDWGIDCCVLNDYQSETNEWILPNKNFVKELRLLNEYPYPLPIVHVYPQNKDTPETIENETKIPKIRITVPFSSIVENISRYVEIKPTTEKYWLTLRDKLKNCHDFDEIEEEVNKLGYKKKGINLEGAKFAILSALDDLKKEGYIDIIANSKKYDYSGTPSSTIKIKDKEKTEEGPIFSMLMKHRYIPILRTEDLLHLRYAEPFLADLLEEVFRYPRFVDYTRRCMAFVPEISKFMEYKEVVKKVEEITARGRAKGVGICYDTHSYSVVKEKIRQNTLFVFAFSQKEDTANMMKKDFDLSDREKNQIINLKQFQCLAISTKGEKWAVYDLFSGKRELKSGTFRGYGLIPLCQHSRGSIRT